MHLPEKFHRCTQVWPICVIQILKILATENKTDHSIKVIFCLIFTEIAEINE